MTVGELEDRMDSSEFTRWMAHDKLTEEQRKLAEMSQRTGKKVMGQ